MTALEHVFPAVRPRKHQDIVGVSPALAGLPPEWRRHFELWMLARCPFSTFDILVPEDKEEVLKLVLPMIDEAFECRCGSSERRRPSGGPAARRGPYGYSGTLL